MSMRTFFYLIICATLFGCSGKDVASESGKKSDTTKKVSPVYSNDIDCGNKEGFAGVYYVPEMLSLCVADSSTMKDLGAKLELDYAGLTKEVGTIGAEVNGPLGQIKYNNDPNNFKFECLALIQKIPAKQPSYGKIVILEATPAAIYNYYGPYEQLYTAYEKLRYHIARGQMEPAGPMREFYVVMPGANVKPKDYLTRILVPVKALSTKDSKK